MCDDYLETGGFDSFRVIVTMSQGYRMQIHLLLFNYIIIMY